ncbi:hypothetical protein L596_008512 [Steinernema carpocapsae]|uniref:Protein kinase domain-containing protein n=1 Tax=Steinernema carpocapsae TaxID=34508 RepID=A0A4U5PCZ9_STECR|nr:hypothetical protein L596_008512 [Steinernema carpocapsae]
MPQKHPVGSAVSFMNQFFTVQEKIMRNEDTAVYKVLSTRRRKLFTFKKVKESGRYGLGKQEYERQLLFGSVSSYTVRAFDGYYEKPKRRKRPLAPGESLLKRDKFRILMEFAPHGDLGSVVSRHGAFDYNVAWRFFDQILAGLGKMHRHGHFHGSIAPRNIFIFSPSECKIGDFGKGGQIREVEGHQAEMLHEEEARDIQDAVETLVFALLGRHAFAEDRERTEEFYDFLDVDGHSDYMDFTWMYPDWGWNMAEKDFFFIRSFFLPRREPVTAPPIYIAAKMSPRKV